jgi:hypothetical protein
LKNGLTAEGAPLSHDIILNPASCTQLEEVLLEIEEHYKNHETWMKDGVVNTYLDLCSKLFQEKEYGYIDSYLFTQFTERQSSLTGFLSSLKAVFTMWNSKEQHWNAITFERETCTVMDSFGRNFYDISLCFEKMIKVIPKEELLSRRVITEAYSHQTDGNKCGTFGLSYIVLKSFNINIPLQNIHLNPYIKKVKTLMLADCKMYLNMSEKEKSFIRESDICADKWTSLHYLRSRFLEQNPALREKISISRNIYCLQPQKEHDKFKICHIREDNSIKQIAEVTNNNEIKRLYTVDLTEQQSPETNSNKTKESKQSIKTTQQNLLLQQKNYSSILTSTQLKATEEKQKQNNKLKKKFQKEANKQIESENIMQKDEANHT